MESTFQRLLSSRPMERLIVSQKFPSTSQYNEYTISDQLGSGICKANQPIIDMKRNVSWPRLPCWLNRSYDGAVLFLPESKRLLEYVLGCRIRILLDIIPNFWEVQGYTEAIRCWVLLLWISKSATAIFFRLAHGSQQNWKLRICVWIYNHVSNIQRH